MCIYRANYLQTALPNNSLVIAGYKTCLASFLMQYVWPNIVDKVLYLLHLVWPHLLFTILCFSAGQAIKKIYHFLMQNQIWIQPKIVSVHWTYSDVGKLSNFDNIQIRAPSHP